MLHESIGQGGELIFRHVPFVGFLIPDDSAAVTHTVMHAGLQQRAPLDSLVDHAAGMNGNFGPSHRDSLAGVGVDPGGGMQYARIQGKDWRHQGPDRVLEPRQCLRDPVAVRGVLENVVDQPHQRFRVRIDMSIHVLRIAWAGNAVVHKSDIATPCLSGIRYRHSTVAPVAAVGATIDRIRQISAACTPNPYGLGVAYDRESRNSRGFDNWRHGDAPRSRGLEVQNPQHR